MSLPVSDRLKEPSRENLGEEWGAGEFTLRTPVRLVVVILKLRRKKYLFLDSPLLPSPFPLRLLWHALNMTIPKLTGFQSAPSICACRNLRVQHGLKSRERFQAVHSDDLHKWPD